MSWVILDFEGINAKLMRNIQYIGDINSSEKQICSDHFMQISCKEIFVVSNLHMREINHHTYQKWDSCQLKLCLRIRKGRKFFLNRYTLYFYFYYTSDLYMSHHSVDPISTADLTIAGAARQMKQWLSESEKSTCGNSHPKSSTRYWKQ